MARLSSLPLMATFLLFLSAKVVLATRTNLEGVWSKFRINDSGIEWFLTFLTMTWLKSSSVFFLAPDSLVSIHTDYLALQKFNATALIFLHSKSGQAIYIFMGLKKIGAFSVHFNFPVGQKCIFRGILISRFASKSIFNILILRFFESDRKTAKISCLKVVHGVQVSHLLQLDHCLGKNRNSPQPQLA